MIEELINDIKKTNAGYLVKNLKWSKRDNIIIGQVLDPVFGKAELYDGFISVQWSKYGKPIKLNKGREDLILNLIK